MGSIDELARAAAAQIDLTDHEDLERVMVVADRLVADADVSDEQLVDVCAAQAQPLELRVAATLARGRRAMLGIEEETHIGVTFAMWGEQNRLRPRSADNPHGEDSLRVKADQLQWATAGTPVQWRLIAVDDGCPFDSAGIAEEIAATHEQSDRISVLRLADHLPATDPPLRGLAGVDDSRKGGAIMLGARSAIDAGADAVVYTDADNSVLLGQLGLLVAPYLAGSRAVLGNRQDPASVLVKDAARWGIGIKNLRHMQRMVGEAIFGTGILDTQAAFKLYERELLEDRILADPTVFDFSFDTDWIAALVASEQPFDQVPFAFIDSAAESASIKQEPMTTWENLLLGLLAALRRHDLLRTPGSRGMAEVLDREIHDYRDLELIIDKLPPELVEASPAQLGDPAVMSAERMGEWIREVKQAG